jgi:hypothetical protein
MMPKSNLRDYFAAFRRAGIGLLRAGAVVTVALGAILSCALMTLWIWSYFQCEYGVIRTGGYAYQYRIATGSGSIVVLFNGESVGRGLEMERETGSPDIRDRSNWKRNLWHFGFIRHVYADDFFNYALATPLWAPMGVTAIPGVIFLLLMYRARIRRRRTWGFEVSVGTDKGSGV